jgi:serine/threonine protein kinase
MDLATFLDGPIHRAEREILYRGVGCLCSAIKYLHQNNFRHEDLKPQHVLIHGDSILLTDFGFNLDFSDDSVSTTTGRPSAWTIRYSAPEVLDFEPRNRATDIWSLGCILLEIVSGFYGTSLSDLKESLQRCGNGQTSFARNTVAVEHWFDDFLEESPAALPTFRHFSVLISTMLSINRLHRPSAQQIVNHISEIRLLVSKSTDDYTASCTGPTPCIGLSGKDIAGSSVPEMIRLQVYHNLEKYLRPWCYTGWNVDFGTWSGM